MDRIDTSLLSTLKLQPTSKPTGPRVIDPTPRLRMTDRQDTVEINRVPAADGTTPARSVAKLVAGSVQAPAGIATAPGTPSARTAAGNAALRMYASPVDQNEAATREASNRPAGSMIDVTG